MAGSVQPRPVAGEVSVRSLRAATYVVGAWLAVGVLSASQYYLAARTAGQPTDLAQQLLREILPWQVWSLLTPVAFWIARAAPLTRRRLVPHLAIHLAAALGCALAYLVVWAVWTKYALPSFGDRDVSSLFWAMFRARFNVAFVLYWAIIGVYYALWNSARLRARAVEAARARAELAQSRLRALRSQLQPHFLFNTLHSIASLMDEDAGTARRLIARLSDLLRTTLELGDTAEAPLTQEIAFVERYLDIERVRFGERLAVDYHIEAAARAALVPPLLLQPLVENAVRHGIAPLERGGRIGIRATRDGAWLAIEVTDTGRWLEAPADGRRGIGLRNLRERLAHTYGDAHSVTLARGPGGGLAVRLRLPYREAGDGRGTDREAG